ncbi:MAG: pimeloyl-[acyl-carrier protein] methyl ester esterase, partial [Gammaproteobacteria bacterium]|nr:pimeloyl-[acyl-carrier protein] methyl ester esterase [Gammaproteobacteria bacterium]
QCPSFWLLGEKDALVPGSVAQELALLAIPQAEFECLKGCAHAPFISHPARSLALVKQFFGTADE